jgi:hypothetical protein
MTSRIVKAKLSFFIFASLVALILAALAVYSYGAVFQHGRYWNGTIARVQDTQASLLRSLFVSPGMADALPKEIDKLRLLFQPLDRKLVVELSENGQRVFSNVNPEWPLGPILEEFSAGGLEVSVRAYVPPSWNSQFLRWVRNPSRWLEPAFDFITFPFLFFFVIFFLSIYAIGWRTRARHLSRDVLARLDKTDSS